MKSMEDVFASILQWSAIRNKIPQLEKIFNSGNCFFLSKGVNSNLPTEQLSVHAYPAIYEGRFYFVSIISVFDTQEEYDSRDMFNHLSINEVLDFEALEKEIHMNTTVTSEEANYRISLWDNHYQEWIKDQVKTPCGIYQAFDIPINDVQLLKGEYIARFALNPDNGHVLGTADLMIEKVIESDPDYSDLVTPVPPFAPQQNCIDKQKEFVKPFFLLWEAVYK